MLFVWGGKQPKFRNLIFAVMAALTLATSVWRAAQSTPAIAVTNINTQVSFQGKLVNTNGTNIADATYNVEFKLYTGGAGTAVGDPGGTLQWTEDRLVGGTGGVATTNGTFQVSLGSVTSLPTNIWNNNTIWLSIQLGNTSNCTIVTSFQVNCGGDTEMVPMVRLTASPYAYNSDLFDGIDSTGFVQLGQSASAQTDGSTNSSIFINKTASGNLLQLQSSGTDAVTLTNTGDLTFGQNANHTISVTQTATNAAGKSLTISAGAGGAGASANAGGDLTVQAGAGGGTNGNGGNVTIDAGLKNGTGTNGVINIGNANASQINVKVVAGANSSTLNFQAPTAAVTYVVQTAAAGTYNICTSAANCTGTYQAAGNYLTKNNAAGDTSSASFAGNLYAFSNTNTGAAGVLALTNSGTNSALSVTQTGTSEPSAGQALILVNNNTTTPTGNLEDLQNKGVSKFSVDVNGNVTALGNITLSGTSPVTVQGTAVNGTLNVTANGTGTLALDTTGAGTISLGTNATTVTLGTGTSAETVNLGISTGTNAINIGTTTAAANTIKIGGTGGAGTNSNAGTVLTLQAGATAQVLNNAGATIQTFTNSATAFQIQNNIGAQSVNVDTTDTNVVTNPSFESNDISAWLKKLGTETTLARIATQHYIGNDALQLTTTATASQGVKQNLTLAPGTYTFSAFLKVSATTSTNYVFGYAADGSTEVDCVSPSPTITTTGWVRYTCTMTTTTTSGTPYFYLRQVVATAKTLYIDGFQIDAGAVAKAYGPGQIALNGVINSPVSLVNSVDSISAFQVQNAASTSTVLVADTLNSRVGIGLDNPQQSLSLAAGDNLATNMATPGIPTLVCNTSGGTMADGTYYYKMVALDGAGGFTIGGPEASCTISGGAGAGSVSITWAFVNGAASYRIYKGVSAGGENAYFAPAGNTNLSYLDTGAAGTAGALPTFTTAYLSKLSGGAANSYFLGNNFGIGTAAPTALLQVVDYKPTDVAGATGTTGGSTLLVTSAAGGDTTIATTGTGGTGAVITMQTGSGGIAASATTASTGGAGGLFTLQGGVGGAAAVAGTGTNTGGAGGAFSWIAGTGGAATGATSAADTGGNGGAVTLQGGTGGAANTGSGNLVGGTGGAVTITGGTGGVGSTSGGNGGLTTIQGGAAAAMNGAAGGAVTIASRAGSSTGTGGVGGILTLQAGAGGTNNSTGTITGNNAGSMTITLGAGGTAPNADVLSTGGNGTVFTINGGAGGTAGVAGTGNDKGGTGAAFTWTAGTGGTATGATSGTNIGGNGGAITTTSGAGGGVSGTGTGNGTGGNGGLYTLQGGVGGASALGGTVNNNGGTGAGFTWTSGAGGAANGATSGINTAGAGGAISLTGGTGGVANTGTGTNTSGAGGAITITGGTGAVASGGATNNGGNGGAVTLQGGTAAAMGGAAGGAATFQSRAGSSTGTGGVGGLVTLQAGAGGTNATATGTVVGNNAGGFTITLGAGGSATAADVSSTGGNGSVFTINGGAGAAASVAGTGNDKGGTGAAFTWTAGTGGGASGATSGTNIGGNGGAITTTSGAGGAATGAGTGNGTGGNGGLYTLQGGAGGNSTLGGTVTNTGGNGAGFTWTAGTGGAANGATSGTNTGGSGGAVTLKAGTGGAASAGSGTLQGGAGGALTLAAGIGGAGTAAGAGGDIILQTATTTVLTERARITAAGNLGVGTASPTTARLVVQGSTSDSSAAAFNAVDSGGATSLLYIRNDGNVGIGTTAPTSSLQVNSNTTSAVLTVNQAFTAAGAYSSADNVITRNIVGGANALTGSVFKITDTSTANAGISIAPTLLLINQAATTGVVTGNLIDAQLAGVSKLSVDTLGDVVAAGTVQYANGATNTNTAVCRNSSGQLAGCTTTGGGTAFVQGGNSFGAAGDLGTNDGNVLNLRTNNATRLTISTTGDLSFVQGGSRTINIAQSVGAGNNLTVAAGQGASGANAGGNLILQGGAQGTSGGTGSVIVKANGTDSSTAFEIQNAAGTNLFVADTSGNNITVSQTSLFVSDLTIPTISSAAVGANTGGSLSGSAAITYYYKLTAVNASGESVASPEVSRAANTFTNLSAPAAPTGVAVVGSGMGTGNYLYKLTVVTANGETTGGTESATITTTAINANVTLTLPAVPTGATGFKVYRTAVGGGTGTELLLTAGGCTGTIATATCTDSATDGQRSGALPGANTARTNLNNVTISFSAITGATRYNLYRATTSGSEILCAGAGYTNITASPFTDNGTACSGAAAPTVSTVSQLGVGTSSATANLDVRGNVLFKNQANTTTAFQVQNSAASTVLNVDTSTSTVSINGALNQGTDATERYYPNVISQAVDNTATGAWIIHTPIPRASNIMGRYHVHGYGYGAQSNIDFNIVTYAYSGCNGSVDSVGGCATSYSLEDNGNDGYSKYIGVDAAGNIAIAFGDTASSSYFYRISVDAWITRSAANYGSGWSIDQNVTAGFGWGDKHGPLVSNSQQQLYVDSNTDTVGIGVSPSGTYKLQVNGSIGASGINSSGTINFGGLTTNRAVFTDASNNLVSSAASSSLLNALTDETGTGVAVFGTSPAITTSLTTASASFDLLNTTATTINFGGGATTALNIGAAAGTTNLLGNTTVAANKNLTLNSGNGNFVQTYATGAAGVADSAQQINLTNNNTGAGIVLQGIGLTPTNTSTPSSGTNTLNVINLAAGGALGGSDITNGINFASATGYTNFIKTPTATLSSAGGLTGLTGVTSSGTINFSGLTASQAVFTDASKNLVSSAASSALLNALTDETGTGVAVFGTSPAITTSLTTGSSSFDLLNTTATTVNFAGAATALSIGATTGSTAINNALKIMNGYGTGNSGVQLTLGGGGTSPNGTSLSFGDNTGWKFNIGTNVTGVFTPRVAFTDSGALNVITGPLQTGNTTRLDASGNLSNIGTITASGNINTTAGAFQLNGSSINTAGVLTNVAYLNQANTFTAATNTFNAAGTALSVTNNATIGTLKVGATSEVSNAILSAVNGGNGIEFGHSNAAGYRSTIGDEASSGAPFIAFNAEAGTNVNTYRTRGIAGAIFKSDLAGGFVFGNAPTATADNQAFVQAAALTSAGNLTLGSAGAGTLTSGAINSQTISSTASFTGTLNVTTGFKVANAAASGNYLRGNGTNFVSSAIQAADIPSGSGNYIQNTASLQSSSNFHISGTGTADTNFVSPDFNVVAANGNGVCFWNDCNNYKIHMGTGATYQYGPVTDYSIKTSIDATAGRGFTWGTVGGTPIAALSNTGNFQIAGTLGVGATATSVLTVQGTQPAAVSGAGTAATQVLGITGGKGGNTNGGTATAGAGAAVNITSGAGGDAVSGSTNGSGGDGGTITIQAGSGGVGIGGGIGGDTGNLNLQTAGGNTLIGSGVAIGGNTLPYNSFDVSGVHYNTGTAGTNGFTSQGVIGVGTSWTRDMTGDEFVFDNGVWGIVQFVNSTTSITLDRFVTVSGTSHSYNIYRVGLSADASTGRVGVGTFNPSAELDVENFWQQPAAATGSFTGTNATDVLFVEGATGGNAVNGVAGVGSNIWLLAGSGGASTGNTGGAGGDISIETGSGGTGTSSGSYGKLNINPYGGNVGIGTAMAAPGAKLEVKGSSTGNVLIGEWGGGSTYGAISLNNSLATGNYNFISSPSDTNLYVNRPSARDIRFRENNTDQITIRATSGNLGIATTAPNYRLDVVQTTGGAAIRVGNSTSDNGAYINDTNGNDGYFTQGVAWNGSAWVAKTTSGSIQGSAGGSFSVYTNSGLTVGNTFTPTERLRLDTSGDLGLGAPASASVLLHVTGSDPIIRLTPTSGTPRIQFTDGTPTNVRVQLTQGLTGNYKDFDIATAGGATIIGVDTSTSRVGIGIDSAAALLQVSGAGGGNDLFRVTDTTATSRDVVRVQDGGAVTLRNQTDSTAALQVQNAASGTDVFTVDTTNSLTSLRGINSTGTLGAELFTASFSFPATAGWTAISGTGSSATATHTAGGGNTALSPTPAMTITAGKVYQVNFTVSGSPTAAEKITPSIGGVSGRAIYGNSTESQLITASTTGNLAFTPTNNWNGTISGVSIKIITQANVALTVNNSDDTAGLEVRAGGSGLYNAFVGLYAGQYSTAGYNAALGAYALTSNTTGTGSVATGYAALTNNTTGYGNVASGYFGLNANTTGFYNIAIGTYTLQLNSTGSNNSALGTGAMESNTSGSSNIAIGTDALWSNVTSSSNIAIGTDAMGSFFDPGSQNIAIGADTLSNNFGTKNTIIGISGGEGYTSGSNDTALGYFSGYQDPTVSSFVTVNNLTNATSIGYGSQVQASNSLILGGQGANAVNVGIGTTIPTNTLSVSPDQYDTGTISQSASTTVTGVGTTFTAAMVGSELIYADGTKDTVTGFTNGTTITVGTSRTHSSSAYRIHYVGLQVTNIGRVGISNSAPGFLLHVGSSNVTTGTSVARFENAGGTCTITPNTAGGITCTSDIRLKKNITNYSDSLSKVMGLQTVQYNLLAESDTDQKHTGFIAQDFEMLFPDLVTTDDQGFKSISYSGLTPYLAQAVQQQQATINANVAATDSLAAQFGTLTGGSGSLVGASLNISGAAQVDQLTVTGLATINELHVTGLATVATLKVEGLAEFDGDIKLGQRVNTRQAITKTFKASKAIPAGSVVVIDDQRDGYVTTTDTANDNRIIGVAVQAASQDGDDVEVAIGGSVQVKFADTDVVKAGQLVSSSTDAGTAMIPTSPVTGAVLGKTTSQKDTDNLAWVLIVLN